MKPSSARAAGPVSCFGSSATAGRQAASRMCLTVVATVRTVLAWANGSLAVAPEGLLERPVCVVVAGGDAGCRPAFGDFE
jgi:hypothetical protein